MNADILEEEQYFPYMGMTLEEARVLRYLISNISSFKNGTIVNMFLKKINDEVILADGLLAEEKDGMEYNKSFNSEIEVFPDAIKVYSIITEEYKSKYEKREFYSIDTFVMGKDDIKVISRVENSEEEVTRIPYFVGEKARMR